MSDRPAANDAKRSLVRAISGTLTSSWQRRPLTPPEIDPKLEQLSAIERISEVLRYQLLRLEYAISSGGGFRAWLKLNLLLGAVLMIPALVVVPVITWLMGSFVTLTGFLLVAAQNLLQTLITIIAFTFLLIAFLFVLQEIWKKKILGQSKGKNRYGR